MLRKEGVEHTIVGKEQREIVRGSQGFGLAVYRIAPADGPPAFLQHGTLPAFFKMLPRRGHEHIQGLVRQLEQHPAQRPRLRGGHAAQAAHLGSVRVVHPLTHSLEGRGLRLGFIRHHGDSAVQIAQFGVDFGQAGQTAGLAVQQGMIGGKRLPDIGPGPLGD